MASQKKPVRDWLYLFIIGAQLFGIIALDLVSFYPKFLWEAPSSPLHFLVSIGEYYQASSGDPFWVHYSDAPWFRVFLYIEGLLQLPLAAYLVYQLASKRPTSGPVELAGLAFGCLTFMGSAACCFELYHMGPDKVSEDKKPSLLYGTYLPFVVIPAVLAVDMFSRLLPRVQASDTKAKAQ